MHQSSTSTYIPNFIEIEETFCGLTDVRIDGHLRPTLLGRLGGVDLINHGVCILDLSLLLIIYTCIFTQIANVDVSFSSCLFLFLMYSCLCCFVSSGDQF